VNTWRMGRFCRRLDVRTTATVSTARNYHLEASNVIVLLGIVDNSAKKV